MCFLKLRRGRPSKVFLRDRGGKKNRYVSDYQPNSANTMGCPCVGSIAKNVAWMEPGGESVCRKDAASVAWVTDGSATADARRNPGIAIQACPDVRETLDYATLASINPPASSQSIGFGVVPGFLPRVRSATSRLQDGELAEAPW